jgi:hypothetical protein
LDSDGVSGVCGSEGESMTDRDEDAVNAAIAKAKRIMEEADKEFIEWFDSHAFEPPDGKHPIPETVENEDLARGVPGRKTFAIYLTVDVRHRCHAPSADDIATSLRDAIEEGGLYIGEADRQGITVYDCDMKLKPWDQS